MPGDRRTSGLARARPHPNGAAHDRPRLGRGDHPAAGDHAGRGPTRRLRRTPRAEALPGFEHVTAGRPWRNQVSTSWLFPLAAFRPITAVPKISAPVLYQIARHDGMPSAGQVDKAIPRTPRAEVKRYPMDHFGPFSPEHHPAVAADASDFLRTRLAT